jgi:IS5 family transposase
MQHDLVQLAGKIDWEFIDGEVAPLYSDKGRPGIETRFVPFATQTHLRPVR